MSDTEDSPAPSPEMDKLVEENPNVDAGQLREAQEALEKLRDEGVIPPGYGITSPYQRRPSSRRMSRRTSR